MTQARRDQLHFPGFQESRNQIRQIWKAITGCEKRAASSSGRKESHNPSAQASGDLLQSKEDENVTHMLSTGLKLRPNFVTRIEEHLKKTFGKLNMFKFEVNTAAWCTFARDCMRASFHMSRSVDTCIRGCQNHSFPKTQDILNILQHF